ncbi:MAG: nitroreductase family deazaflavin-dependent oxidoreductase [Acidimicrobiia bacterium]|nr:nitroreductase family deazaflavin-dependent oxidoreductase [Acidimicrobiia bacterium]
MGAYRSLIRWIGDKPWFRWAARWVLPWIDKRLLSRGWRATPFPTLLLTTTGHQSGASHEAPLYYLEDEGFVVIASNYGNHEPDWSRNLVATPVCRVKVGTAEVAARAEAVGHDRWHHYLDRFASFYPPYRDYVQRAGRDIPMWRLVPQPAEA